MSKKTLFLTLRVFSAMGGIERVCRVLGKALYELQEKEERRIRIYSMYDTSDEIEEKYFPRTIFKGFNARKLHFILSSIREGMRSDRVVLSHVHLLSVAILIKLFSPRTKIILIAHGIEVWKKIGPVKRAMLKKISVILAVSRFTKDKMIGLHGLPELMFEVLNNCLDPFLPPFKPGPKDPVLMKKYGIRETDIVLMTITRLSERYKNCDKVLSTMQYMAGTYPQLRYLLVGSYGNGQQQGWIEEMSEAMGLKESVIMTGFVPDEVLHAYHNLADVFIMLGEQEGFGLVLIESMYYGKPVIGADRGGVTDALRDGTLGLLVDPLSEEQIGAAIQQIVADPAAHKPDQQKVLEHFGYDTYVANLRQILQAY